MAVIDALAALQKRYSDRNYQACSLLTYSDGKSSGQDYVRVEAGHLVEVARFLHDDPACRFEQLSDLTCVDYLNYPDPSIEDRFGVTYGLLSVTHNHRLWIKCFVNDPDPIVPSVTSIWKGAEWLEREVFDMFGVRFAGHPDLRRILCPDWFQDHALRKDYPLRGKGEREQFEIVARDSA